MIARIFSLLITLFISVFVFADPETTISTSSDIPFEMKVTESSSPNMLRVIVALGIVIACAFAIILFLKKYIYKESLSENHKTDIKLLSSKRISIKTTLHHVSIDGSEYIIAEKDTALAVCRHENTTMENTG